MSAAAFLKAQLGTVKALAEAVRQDGPNVAIVALDRAMPLVSDWLLPRIAEASIAHAETDDAGVGVYALDARTLADLLRLDRAPIEGPLDSFRSCACALDSGQTRIVAVARDEDRVETASRPGLGTVQGAGVTFRPRFLWVERDRLPPEKRGFMQTGVEGPIITSAAALAAAGISAFVALVAAFVSAWNAQKVTRLQADLRLSTERQLEEHRSGLARELKTSEAALRVRAERQLEVFKLAASSAEQAVGALLEWLEGLEDFSRAETSKGPEAFYECSGALHVSRRAAEKAGLLLPPGLDTPYLAALEALRTCMKAISVNALSGNSREEAIGEHFRSLERSREVIDKFLSEVRRWKSTEWAPIVSEASAPIGEAPLLPGKTGAPLQLTETIPYSRIGGARPKEDVKKDA